MSTVIFLLSFFLTPFLYSGAADSFPDEGDFNDPMHCEPEAYIKSPPSIMMVFCSASVVHPDGRRGQLEETKADSLLLISSSAFRPFER